MVGEPSSLGLCFDSLNFCFSIILFLLGHVQLACEGYDGYVCVIHPLYEDSWKQFKRHLSWGGLV